MGCFKKFPRNDLTGKKFGRLTVIRFFGYRDCNHFKRPRREQLWECKCDCGKVKNIIGRAMSHGKTVSCGCYHSEVSTKIIERFRLPLGVAAIRKYYTLYRMSAKQRELEFNIDKKLFEKLIKGNCYYCGVSPFCLYPYENDICNGRILVNGLDRIDNNKGYVIDNVVTCCKICNYSKHKMKYEDFLVWIDRISNHKRIKLSDYHKEFQLENIEG